MPLDLSVVGTATEPARLAYDWRTLATYALGIGAKRDELAYLYEGTEGGIRAYPTFAVVPAFEPVMKLLVAAKVDLAAVVHGAQGVRSLRPLPPSGELVTVGRLTGLYDMKKFAQVVVSTESRLEGEVVFTTEWSIIVRGGGNFGGPRPPQNDAPDVPKDRPSDWTFEEVTSPEQALLYRISGDVNPLHADPAFAERVGFKEGPILHGLATYGFAARALVRSALGGDASRLGALRAQFRRPVWPGDTLVTQGWDLGEGRVALTTAVKGREAVLGSAWAEVR